MAALLEIDWRTVSMDDHALMKLTWSTPYFGEHTTTVDGNGRNPGMKELLVVGKAANLPQKVCQSIATEIQEKTPYLKRYSREN